MWTAARGSLRRTTANETEGEWSSGSGERPNADTGHRISRCSHASRQLEAPRVTSLTSGYHLPTGLQGTESDGARLSDNRRGGRALSAHSCLPEVRELLNQPRARPEMRELRSATHHDWVGVLERVVRIRPKASLVARGSHSASGAAQRPRPSSCKAPLVRCLLQPCFDGRLLLPHSSQHGTPDPHNEQAHSATEYSTQNSSTSRKCV